MKVVDFIKELKSIKTEEEKNKFIKKHIVKTYIPYLYKITVANQIVTNSSVDEDGKYQINSPIRYMLFCQQLLIAYTDIEQSNESPLNDYDLLEQEGVFEKLISFIGRDYDRFMTVLNMTMDDYIANNRDLASYMDKKIEDLKDFIDMLSSIEGGDSIVGDENKN